MIPPFSEAVMLGAMGVELSAYEQEPFAIACKSIALPPTFNGNLNAIELWPWLQDQRVEFHCCESELAYGPMVYCRLAHIWDAHLVMPMPGKLRLNLDQYCDVIRSVEPGSPVVPWNSREEQIEWLQEMVAEQLQKERETRK